MKKHTLLSLGAAALLTLLTACDDYLDKEPSKNTNKTITDVSQLDALLATYSALYSEYNHSFLATDDYGLTPEIHKQMTSSSSSDDLDVFTWSSENERSSRNMWDSEYAKIFRANLVLNNIDDVTGSEEDKTIVRAEAHLVRAYSLFQLAVSHCLYPSSENSGELGLPLRSTTSFEEPIARATLGETFSFIESEITEALKITKPYVNNGTRETWRGTTASVKAFAARFYLYLGDYDLAKQYAEEVLAEYSTLKDFNDPAQMYYSYNDDTYTINSGTSEEEVITVKYPYTKLQFYGTSGYPEFLAWEDLLFARTMSYASWWFLPSQDLLDTYKIDIKDGNPDNDLRYRYFVIEDFGLRYCNKTTAGRTYGYCQFYYDNLISGPTVPEMLLIKAEALARGGNAGDAIIEINKLRRSRIATEAYEDLPAGTVAEALKRVLDERRREMPFTIRWYDLKRYAWNDDPSDDVTVSHPFYPYTTSSVLDNDAIVSHTLEPKSRHYALPIPQVDIMRSDNVLVQNTY